MQIYLLKKGVCPFTPPIDQGWHSFTRGIKNDAFNNKKVIWSAFQVDSNTVRRNSPVGSDKIGLWPDQRCWYENPNGT